MKMLKCLRFTLVFNFLLLSITASVWAEWPAAGQVYKAPNVPQIQGMKIATKSFQVANFSHDYVVQGDRVHFKIIVDFNKDVDPGSIAVGTNFRFLKRGMDGFWRDAYHAQGNLQVNGKRVTWISGEPAVEGTQKLHLRGTIKSASGDFLDCDGDGKAEGGNMPAYESGILHLVL